MTFDLHRKQQASSTCKSKSTNKVWSSSELWFLEVIVCTPFSDFDLCWPQVAFDLYKNQLVHCPYWSRCTYHTWGSSQLYFDTHVFQYLTQLLTFITVLVLALSGGTVDLHAMYVKFNHSVVIDFLCLKAKVHTNKHAMTIIRTLLPSARSLISKHMFSPNS